MNCHRSIRIKTVNDLLFDTDMSIGKIIGFIFVVALLSAFLISYNNAVKIAQQKVKVNPKVEVEAAIEPNPQIPESFENRRIYLTILDCNNDTIATNEIYHPESDKFWNKFKDDSTYTISFTEFIRHSYDDNIGAYDMAYMRVQLGILQRGNLAFVKKEFSNKKNYKYDFVSNINWLSVNATQLSSEILDWDISVGGYSDFISDAVKKNWSYAKTKYYLQSDEKNNNNAYKAFIKSAADSVFQKGARKDFYFLSFSDWQMEEGECFGIHDLGIVSDINNDGFADRIATWHDYNTGGVCGITKKSNNGLIEFFHFSQPIN